MAEEKELQLYLATNTLHFIEQELSLSTGNQLQEELKKKFELQIHTLTKEVRRHKKAKHNNEEIKAAPPDDLLNARLEISKFQRDLLLKLHKEGDFSDAVIKLVEQEMDINELKLNLQVPKEE